MGQLFGNPLRAVDNVDVVVITISANTTLSNASFGKSHLITGAFNVMLPLLSTGKISQRIHLMNDSSTATATITANGSDIIKVKGVNQVSITLPPGEAVAVENTNGQWSLADTAGLKAPIVSPAFTGTPTAPTAPASTNTTQVATTAYVIGQGSTSNPVQVGTAAPGVSLTFSKSDHVHPNTAATQIPGTNDNSLATTAFVTTALQAVFPIGSLYTNTTYATNPATLLGFGTWALFGAGRVLVGVNSGDATFSTLGATGGSKDAVVVSHTHNATVSDPGHAHTYNNTIIGGAQYTDHGGNDTPQGYNYPNTSSNTTGITVSNSTTGVSGTNANLPPYITVYMWTRTA